MAEALLRPRANSEALCPQTFAVLGTRFALAWNISDQRLTREILPIENRRTGTRTIRRNTDGPDVRGWAD